MARMQLSEEAYKAALNVGSIRDAEEFLDAYGSHVSNGRQEVRGDDAEHLFITALQSQAAVRRIQDRVQDHTPALSNTQMEVKNASDG